VIRRVKLRSDSMGPTGGTKLSLRTQRGPALGSSDAGISKQFVDRLDAGVASGTDRTESAAGRTQKASSEAALGAATGCRLTPAISGRAKRRQNCESNFGDGLDGPLHRHCWTAHGLQRPCLDYADRASTRRLSMPRTQGSL